MSQRALAHKPAGVHAGQRALAHKPAGPVPPLKQQSDRMGRFELEWAEAVREAPPPRGCRRASGG